MKATEKEHAIKRVHSVAESLKEALVTLEKPDLHKHIVSAIMDGKVTLLPAKPVVEAARTSIANSTYQSDRVLRFSHVFAPPASYTKALDAYEAEQRGTDKRRKAIDREAQRIIDAIHFGKITDPAEAIAQMEQFRA